MGDNIDKAQVGVSFEAQVDMGGISINDSDFVGQVTSTSCSVKTSGYSAAPHALNVNAQVGLGGISLTKGAQTSFQFSA